MGGSRLFVMLWAEAWAVRIFVSFGHQNL